MTQVVKIGTRESELALWQAKKVQNLLQEQGAASELVLIKSEGDIDLSTPLYEIGVQGIFTKSLDIALLQKRIDIAVHSYKDVPTQLASGITIAAVLKRDAYLDILGATACRSECHCQNPTPARRDGRPGTMRQSSTDNRSRRWFRSQGWRR